MVVRCISIVIAAASPIPNNGTMDQSSLLPSAGKTWQRIDGIDLLRGLSILFVLMNHVNMRLFGAHVLYTKGLPLQLTYSLVWNGQFAVQMFFVISGFLITSTSIRRWNEPESLNVRSFYLLRLARIAPLMILLLLILSGLHLAHVRDYVVSEKAGGLGRALVAALTFHIGYLEATRGYLPGTFFGPFLSRRCSTYSFLLWLDCFASSGRSPRYSLSLFLLDRSLASSPSI